jgi:hypothetical protein
MSGARPPEGMSQRAMLERLLSDGCVRRSAQLVAEGVQPQAISDAVRAGVVTKAAPGAYYLTLSVAPPERLAIAVACVRAPRGTVCLLTAAWLCGLADAPSPITWLALPVGAHIPRPGNGQEQFIHWSYDGAFDVGVVSDEVCGVRLLRTDPSRTIVDLFRYSRYLGGDHGGMEAGIRFLRQGGDPSAVLDVAHRLAAPATTMRRLEVAVNQWQGALV